MERKKTVSELLTEQMKVVANMRELYEQEIRDLKIRVAELEDENKRLKER